MTTKSFVDACFRHSERYFDNKHRSNADESVAQRAVGDQVPCDDDVGTSDNFSLTKKRDLSMNLSMIFVQTSLNMVHNMILLCVLFVYF